MAEVTIGDRLLTIQANGRRLALLVKLNASWNTQDGWAEATEFQRQLQTQVQAVISLPIDDLPPSRAAIYSQINLAQSFITLGESAGFSGIPSATAIQQRLTQAQQQAVTLQDRQAQSYALGALGRLYEQRARQSSQTTEREKLLATSATVY